MQTMLSAYRVNTAMLVILSYPSRIPLIVSARARVDTSTEGRYDLIEDFIIKVSFKD